MKHKIFISYSDFDKRKVDLIRKELENNSQFEPIIIAANREALKPLVDKVSEGILDSEIIIPILTKSSITTQWINQEIGFATAMKKIIRPIIEKDIINDLKGFIHKQIDLPYHYDRSDNNGLENKNFINAFRKLMFDLGNSPNFKVIIPEKPKSMFEKIQEKIDKEQKEAELNRQKEAFLSSPEATEITIREIKFIVENIKTKIKILLKQEIYISSEEVPNPLKFVFKYNLHSVGVGSNYANARLNLYIGYWKGLITLEPNPVYHPDDQPKRVAFAQYSINKDETGQISWIEIYKKQKMTSEEIADNCLEWLLKVK